MLIRIAKPLEIPEILQEDFILTRAVTRLKRIYNGNYCVRNPLELTAFVDIIFGGVVEDGELIPKGSNITRGDDHLPDDMIKQTSEIVQHFTDSQSQIFGNGRYFSEAVDVVSRYVVDLFDDSIGFEVTEG